ncbi:MAG: lactate racemase domain-containing protein [Candidatus Eisenbacteria bacterium]
MTTPGVPAPHGPRVQDLVRAAEALAEDTAPTASERILVVLPDRTRAFPIEPVLPVLLRALLARGARPVHLTVAIASGSHVPGEADVARLGSLPPEVRLLRHNPDGPSTSLGTTARGTEVRVHPALVETDTVLALGGLAFHYFAGFGGGGKMLFPGLGERRSIASNHRLTLGDGPGLAPGVEPGRTGDNPVWLDLREAHHLLPRARHLTLWRADGDWCGDRWSEFEVFDALCDSYAAPARVGERHGADLVLASCGDAAREIDVVQAHKALFHAALFVRDGGEIVLFAECPEGIGSPALARWLAQPDRVTLEARAREAYDLNAQTAISLAAIAARARVPWVAANPPRARARSGIATATPDQAARGERVLTLSAAADRIPAPTSL